MHLKCEVLLLADVFEKFRDESLKNYGLCPSHYLSALALSWGAMLNMTKVEFELIPDPDMYIFFGKGTRGRVSYISIRYSTYPDMYIFFGKGTRGRVSYISIRYSKANNKYLKSYFKY